MLNPVQMATVRRHPSSRELENTGWIVLADRNVCGNVVHLVSKHRDVALEFPHKEPYHDHLRAYCTASMHAQTHPELAAETPKGELEIVPLQVAA